MPQKIRELKAMLLKVVFTERAGKGSHSIWIHEKLPELLITIAGKDREDAKIYLEKYIK
ncbi:MULTISPECIES: type II toxin-antitoxin system HicA family toxin [unclassified Synechocystis]|uniref:type II toxin-antitoxin system HicA family toxin n=1 Tax=unclassified Synechocystis TaxID=2640012 RepID=UPI0011874607|nr:MULTISPECIES: type II toxin-antitoxin system HicA family toxin [unclassified Synechocystis]MCT0252769.1 type II toxin-antitoxin system HicA family toxin [Synechocystis sp. CS-94]